MYRHNRVDTLVCYKQRWFQSRRRDTQHRFLIAERKLGWFLISCRRHNRLYTATTRLRFGRNQRRMQHPDCTYAFALGGKDNWHQETSRGLCASETPLDYTGRYTASRFLGSEHIEEPVRVRSAAPVRVRSVVLVRARTAVPVQARTVVPVRARTAVPVRARTAVPVQARTVVPVQARTVVPVQERA